GVEGYASDRIIVAGAAATFVADNGAVIRGNTFELPDAGELVLNHEAGLVMAWIERRGKSPWPETAPKPLAAPQSVKLDGQAMRFALKQDRPVLLHVRTTAPVALSLAQAGGATGVMLFPAGAELHRYVGAGTAELRLYSPHEGPLAGSLELTATPVVPIAEGLGEARAVAPGATALFGFEVTRAGSIGVGIRSEPGPATGFTSHARAQAPQAQMPMPLAGQLDRLQRADGAKVVPERFLRSWDPVTLFFDRDRGPQAGGPEDAPERFVTMKPAVPGAWQW